MSKKESHITYEDKIKGVIFMPKLKYKICKLHVRYSASNISDTISFSDDKNFLVQLDVNSLKKLLDKYEVDNE